MCACTSVCDCTNVCISTDLVSFESLLRGKELRPSSFLFLREFNYFKNRHRGRVKYTSSTLVLSDESLDVQLLDSPFCLVAVGCVSGERRRILDHHLVDGDRCRWVQDYERAQRSRITIT